MNQKKMKREKNEINRARNFSIVIYIILILGAVAIGFVRDYSIVKNMVNIVTAVVCGILVQCFYTHSGGKYIRELHSEILCLFCLAITIVLIFLYDYEFVGGLWLISVAVISVIDGMKHGMIFYFLSMVQYVLYATDYIQSSKKILYYLVLGAVVVLIFAENSIKELLYSTIAMIALSAVLLIIQFGFDVTLLKENKTYLIIQIMSSFVIAFTAFIVRYMFEQFGKIKCLCVEDTEKMSNLLESDYELIRRLQAFSANLFIHSMRVSVMSMRVSQKMGYNSLLAKAGGMYHEIGRIKKEENYVEATNDIAYAYDFPKCLTDLILQVCDKDEKPESREAMVVMLSDSIVSMIEYFEKNTDKSRPSKEKLIESVFANRQKKGNFDNCDISEKEIEGIKETYKNINMDF
ncbi:MAG: HDIG domain-containing protein [Clostridium sp.]|uniref:HDIG domain-containing metalloprotein n=1 Tax=Butyribacter sp. TaxID=2822465 RepID=UPI002A9E0F18|nr:HDIG domain-containing protein [Clostridium sp.]MDY5180971.1 HDIG domain-containing protein [Butyribacter sp.]